MAPSKVRFASPSKVFAVPEPEIIRLFALLFIVVPVTVCQEQDPSPSSLKNLVPPDSPVDNIAVPSGVEEIVCQVLSPLKNLVVTELPDPSLATFTVPLFKLDAFPAVKPPDVPETLPVTFPVRFATNALADLSHNPLLESH